jgi:hypothetical protein
MVKGRTGVGRLTRFSPALVQSVARTVFRILAILAIAYCVHLLMNWLILKSEVMSSRSQTFMLTSIIAAMLLAYAVLISVPFVPGIEIGVSLILIRGPEIVPYVFAETVAVLAVAYFAGQFIRTSWLLKIFLVRGLKRPADFLQEIQAIPTHQRIDLMCERLPDWLGPHLVKWRYVLLAVLVNIPGNALIGGGGGICLMAGLSRVFTPLATVVTILIAVAPVPLMVWVFDIDVSNWSIWSILPHPL